MLPPNCNGTRAFSARRAEHFRFRPVRIPQCRLTDGRTAAQGPAEGLVPSSHGTGYGPVRAFDFFIIIDDMGPFARVAESLIGNVNGIFRSNDAALLQD